ncbi:MAG: hypothetical protein ABF370_08115, partial [Verrucomicrobiales bacterium]
LILAGLSPILLGFHPANLTESLKNNQYGNADRLGFLVNGCVRSWYLVYKAQSISCLIIVARIGTPSAEQFTKFNQLIAAFRGAFFAPPD